jgi:hypothetical protein
MPSRTRTVPRKFVGAIQALAFQREAPQATVLYEESQEDREVQSIGSPETQHLA